MIYDVGYTMYEVRLGCQRYLLAKSGLAYPTSHIVYRISYMKTIFTSVLTLILVNFCAAQSTMSVRFSKDAGVYNDAIRVSLEASIKDAKIYYTTDGTQPNTTKERYRKPISLRKNTVLQVVAYANGKKSKVFTRSYFFDEKTDFALVSLVVEPFVLFDPEKGWFNMGPNADTTDPYVGANFWSRKEEPAHIEIFESDGKLIFSDRIGVRLFGGMSRLFPQKSFAVSTRTVYGDRRIKYPIFPEKNITKYKHLVLRNAGSDFPKAHFRDAFMTSLMDGVDIEKQAHRPALLFINGDYWGIYFIREKINKYFVAHNCGVDKDSIDLIEHRMSVKQGDSKHYQAMLNFMAKNDLGKKENYDYIKTQMDVENFMTYQIAQIFFDNQDAGGNIKFWRPRTADGRWRWILYDTDWGFGLQEPNAARNNSLAFHTEANGPEWPNPPWSTFILRNLLENKEFEQDFILRFSDYLNTIFEPNFTTTRIDSFYNMMLPEISRHHERWELNRNIWENHIRRMKIFAKDRPNQMRRFLKQKFKLGDLARLEIAKFEGGEVALNRHISLVNEAFSGLYFQNSTIKLQAIADYGYQFSHWEGLDGVLTDKEILVDLKSNNTIKPIFKKIEKQAKLRVIINEISSNDEEAEDWIELYNPENKPVNLKGWTLKDNKQNEFRFPAVSIAPKQYLVVCRDTSAFKLAFPEVFNIVGNFRFGINKTAEDLVVRTPTQTQIDSISYDLEVIDSTYTLALRDFVLDNADGTSWDVVMNTGTPGRKNKTPAFKTTSTRKWLPWMVGGGLLVVGMVLMGRSRK